MIHGSEENRLELETKEKAKKTNKMNYTLVPTSSHFLIEPDFKICKGNQSVTISFSDLIVTQKNLTDYLAFLAKFQIKKWLESVTRKYFYSNRPF